MRSLALALVLLTGTVHASATQLTMRTAQQSGPRSTRKSASPKVARIGLFGTKTQRASRMAQLVGSLLLATMGTHAFADTIDATDTAQMGLPTQYAELAADVKAPTAAKFTTIIQAAKDRITAATTDEDKAQADLFLAGALGDRYTAKLGTLDDARQAFHLAQAGFKLEPHEQFFSVSYARPLRVIANLPFYKRPFATGSTFGVDIDLKLEIQSVLDPLNEQPNDAVAQIVQRDLGTFLHDKAVVDRANANLAHFSDADRAAAAKVVASDDSVAAAHIDDKP